MPNEAQPTNILQEAGAVLSSPEFAEFRAEIPEVVKESKAGYKTTEFWLVVVGSLVTALGVVPTPHDAKGFVLAGLAAAYAVARGIAKHNIAAIEPAPVAVAPADAVVQRSGADAGDA